MLSNKLPADRETILAAYDELEAAHDKIAEMSHEVLADHELADLLNRRERMHRRHRAVDHELIARLDGASPCELGAATLPDALTQRLRISRAEARRRIGEAQDLGPRRAVTGEPLAPRLAITAAGEARGEVSPEHVKIIRRFFNQLPSWVDHRTREQAEATLGRIACEFGPEELRSAADRLMALLDEDGEEPHDIDRARKRHLIIGRQQADGMSPIRGLLDPEARATLDAVLAKWAATGQCNPTTKRRVWTRKRAKRRRSGISAAKGSATTMGSMLYARNGTPALASPRQCLEHQDRGEPVMSGSNGPMAAVLQYVDAFNNGDAKAMAAACANPMQILDGMSPHVWQGPTAAEDWWSDVLTEGEHLEASGYHITLGEPRHIDVTGDYGYVVVPATMTFDLQGKHVEQTGSVFTVALRKVGTDWRLAAWAWAKGSHGA